MTLSRMFPVPEKTYLTLPYRTHITEIFLSYLKNQNKLALFVFLFFGKISFAFFIEY